LPNIAFERPIAPSSARDSQEERGEDGDDGNDDRSSMSVKAINGRLSFLYIAKQG
jgi:hypothetical protein